MVEWMKDEEQIVDLGNGAWSLGDNFASRFATLLV
jgi:hypothetical protein